MVKIRINLKVGDETKYQVEGSHSSSRLTFNQSDEIMVDNQEAFDKELRPLYSKIKEEERYRVSDICNILLDKARRFKEETKIEIILNEGGL